MQAFALTFCVSFAFVALRAFQQLNVQHSRYWWVMPTSMLMAVCEITIVTQLVKTGLALAIPLGLGAGLGCIAAMQLHNYLRKSRGH